MFLLLEFGLKSIGQVFEKKKMDMKQGRAKINLKLYVN